MVVYDPGDDDLLVVQNSGLRLPSVARIHKFATIEKAIVVRQLGKIGSKDYVLVSAAFRQLFEAILPVK